MLLDDRKSFIIILSAYGIAAFDTEAVPANTSKNEENPPVCSLIIFIIQRVSFALFPIYLRLSRSNILYPTSDISGNREGIFPNLTFSDTDCITSNLYSLSPSNVNNTFSVPSSTRDLCSSHPYNLTKSCICSFVGNLLPFSILLKRVTSILVRLYTSCKGKFSPSRTSLKY